MSEPTAGDVDDVTVLGAGTMGHGIAQVFAMAEYDVTLVDVAEAALAEARANIEASLERLGEAPAPVLARITTTTDRGEGFAGADLLVEAVPEEIELKREVFAAADRGMPAHAVLATNTSTLPVTEIAAATDRPERVVGMHFSNPVPLIDIVEVIRGERTSDATLALARSLSEAVGKAPVVVEKDVPGFLLNRINYAFWSEALRQVDAGNHDPEVVDAAIRRLGFPMGPFEVLDFAGVDVFYMACQSMQDRGVPVVVSETHERLVEDGRYGMKTGAGFYEYPEAGSYERVAIPDERRYECDPYPMIASATNAAAWLLDNDVATRADIDRAMEVGMSWPRGVLAFADEYGIDRVVRTLERLHAESGREQYEPNPLLRRMVARDELGVGTGSGFYDHDHERASFGGVEYERRAFLAVVTLPAPDRGTIDRSTWRGLRSALERAAGDDGVRATVLGGDGEGFALPNGIAEMRDWETVEEGTTYFEEVVIPSVEALRTHPKPTVALVEGAATGVGCELVLLSDLAVASRGSRFGQPEATMGTLPPLWLAHGAASVGKKKLLELAMTGDTLPASEAADIGLVNYAVADEQARDVARELARSTTGSAPQSVAAITRRWTDVEDELAANYTRAITELVELGGTAAGRRGLSSAFDGDPPPWEL